jgi:hypothetical protein
MSENVFRVLGIQSREDCISNAIAYAFNVSQKFRNSFLMDVCGKNPNDYDAFLAYTRVSVAGHGIPDIVIRCANRVMDDLIVIENKLRAEEEDQTERYASKSLCESLRNRICPNRTNVSWTFIFLTLFPDQEPQSPKFSHKTHKCLIRAVSDFANPGSLAERLVRDWGALVSNFYKMEMVEADDRVLDKLRDDDGLDGGYLYFRNALLKLDLGSLSIDGFFRSSQQGRRYYGAIISKNEWRPAEMESVNETRNLDPAQNFHIHFEPQYDVLNQVLKLYLHYETYPYYPESWVRKHILISQYSEFVARRTSFFECLKAKAPERWKFKISYNQIAKADLNFADQTFSGLKDAIEARLKAMSVAIDDVLCQISS